jgi:hypothetical protein
LCYVGSGRPEELERELFHRVPRFDRRTTRRRARGGVVEASLAVDSGYWLSQCEGFRVDVPGGSLGFVEEIVFAGPGSEPEALVVVGGFSGTRRWLVPVGDVAVVQPHRERVSLESSPAQVGLLTERRAMLGMVERQGL